MADNSPINGEKENMLFTKMKLMCLIFLIMPHVIHADADTRTVTAEYQRCYANMERFERSLRHFEESLDRLKETIAKLAINQRNDPARELTTLENRREYFRNRYERSRSQSEKLRDDLKNVGGPTCPSCIQSGVNLYCRMIDMVQNELDDYTARSAELQHRLSRNIRNAAAGSTPPGDGRNFKRYRSSVDSLYRSMASCRDAAAKTLLDQVKITIARADSLDKCKQGDPALQSLDIAGALLRKAVDRCSEDK